MEIYIIQEITESVAECPVLFIDETLADQHYIKLVNEVFDKDFKNEKEASDFLRKNESFKDIHYWVTKIKS